MRDALLRRGRQFAVVYGENRGGPVRAPAITFVARFRRVLAERILRTLPILYFLHVFRLLSVDAQAR